MNFTQVAPLAELAGATRPSEPNLPQRILVVEDDADIRQLNAEVLAGCGYAVDAAEDGAVAWEALQANRYDLVITDWNMPRVTGVQLIRRIYNAQIDVPVIMVTGATSNGKFAYPPAAVLLKPYTFVELLGIVKEVLGVGAVASETVAPPSPWPGELARQNRLHKNLAG